MSASYQVVMKEVDESRYKYLRVLGEEGERPGEEGVPEVHEAGGRVVAIRWQHGVVGEHLGSECGAIPCWDFRMERL